MYFRRSHFDKIVKEIETDTTDALHFNNLVIGAESATNPIVKKLLMLNYIIYFFDFIFKYL
jgi:hypothetical protein